MFKGIGSALKGIAKNPLQALLKSPLKVGLPALGVGLLASQLFKRKKVRPEVPEHIQALQQQMSPLAQGLLGYAQRALGAGLQPSELQLAQQEAQLGQGLGGAFPLLGTFLGGALAGGGFGGLNTLREMAAGTQNIFARPEYQQLFAGLRQQAARAMEETVSPILSQMQAMGLGTSSAAVGELARAQERIMEDLQRQIAGIAAQGAEAERQRQLVAAEQLFGGIPTALDVAMRGGLGGMEALGMGTAAAGLPRTIAQSILGMTPFPEAFLAMGTYPLYAPSVGEQLLGAGGQLAAIYDIFRRRRS